MSFYRSAAYACVSKQLLYRAVSFGRYTGTHVETRADAEALADQLRARIRAGQFGKPAETAGESAARDGTLTCRAFAAEWPSRRGYQLVQTRDNDYRLKLIYAFALPARVRR